MPHELRVLSAHRTPDAMAAYAREAHTRGLKVLIAGAGGAAHLPGMLAAHTPLPVIGVPVPSGNLNGLDALLSIVQMPRGVPVATVAIGGGGTRAYWRSRSWRQATRNCCKSFRSNTVPVEARQRRTYCSRSPGRR